MMPREFAKWSAHWAIARYFLFLLCPVEILISLCCIALTPQLKFYLQKISAYGVLGFISFMESYYLILVTKRTKSAVIGMHIIYTIKDTVMIRVCEPSTKMSHPLEQRYLRIFNNIDLNSNFYFSYSYDLTRTLQHNLSSPRFIGKANIETDEPLPDWNDHVSESEFEIRIAKKLFHFVLCSARTTPKTASSTHSEVCHESVLSGMPFYRNP